MSNGAAIPSTSELPRAALVLDTVALLEAVAILDTSVLNAETVVHLRKARGADGDQQQDNQKESNKARHE
ncbi:hypothetical protein NBRC116589_14590 [Ruegeria sp. HU-ET01832]